jgi:hypothetical protein
VRTLLKDSEAVGKTVECVEFGDGYVSVLFVDNTALVFSADVIDDDYADIVVVRNGLMASQAYCLGLIDKEELNRMSADEYKASIDKREREDRETYERLRAKFETSQ